MANDIITINEDRARQWDKTLQELSKSLSKKGFGFCAPLYNLSVTNGAALLGYDSVYDYAADVLGRSKAATSAYIRVAKRFFVHDEKTGLCTNKVKAVEGGFDYAEFPIVHLFRISSCTDAEIAENFSPEMSQKEVEASLKALKERKNIEAAIDKRIKEHNKELEAAGAKAGDKSFIDKNDVEARKSLKEEILSEREKNNEEDEKIKEFKSDILVYIEAVVDRLVAGKADSGEFPIRAEILNELAVIIVSEEGATK